MNESFLLGEEVDQFFGSELQFHCIGQSRWWLIGGHLMAQWANNLAQTASANGQHVFGASGELRTVNVVVVVWGRWKGFAVKKAAFNGKTALAFGLVALSGRFKEVDRLLLRHIWPLNSTNWSHSGDLSPPKVTYTIGCSRDVRSRAKQKVANWKRDLCVIVVVVLFLFVQRRKQLIGIQFQWSDWPMEQLVVIAWLLRVRSAAHCSR